LALNLDPLRPIAHRMDLTIQSPPGLPRTGSPALPGFGHTPEGGSVAGRRAALGLGHYQPHFVPLARTFALPWARCHCANERAVCFGYDVWVAHGGQHPKRLRVFGL